MRLQQAPCGYLAFDDLQVVRDVNVEGAQWLGYAPADLLNRPLGDLLPPEGRMFFGAYVYPLLAETGRADEIYVSLLRAGGDELPVLLSVARRDSPEPALSEAIFLRIRRRNVFERQLAQAQEREEKAAAATRAAVDQAQKMAHGLELSERMAALGVLAAGVAHEINNPLTYVKGNLDILAMTTEPWKEKLPELAADLVALNEAQLGVSRIREIVSALRVLSRVDPARRVPVLLADVVNVATRLVRHEIVAKGRLELDLAPSSPCVLGDESRLGQVVMNLMLNAAQALPGDTPERNVVSVTTRLESGRALIEVCDNGPGVPREIRARIFDPFFTTKPVGVGTGLGLSICHQIVSSLGGELTLQDPPGGGACFRVALPPA